MLNIGGAGQVDLPITAGNDLESGRQQYFQLKTTRWKKVIRETTTAGKEHGSVSSCRRSMLISNLVHTAMEKDIMQSSGINWYF